jgi:hypothetical protein
MAADGAIEGSVQGGTLLRLFAEEEQAANTLVRGGCCNVKVEGGLQMQVDERTERLIDGRGRVQRQQGAGAGGLGGARNDDVDKFWKLGYGCDPSLEAPMVRVNA